MGYTDPQILYWYFPVFGVDIFFAISGYLVSDSWINDPSLPRYLLKRSLRIFPALIVVVLLTTFVVGPAVSNLSLSQYFSSPSTYFYLCNIRLFVVYWLPGVFGNNPYHAVNGCLWTLPVEFSMYLFTPVFFTLVRKHRAIALAAATVIFGVVAIYLKLFYRGPQIAVYGTGVMSALLKSCFFTGGAMLRVVRNSFEPNLKWSLPAIILVVLLSTMFGGLMAAPIYVAAAFILPCSVLALANCTWLPFQKIGRHGDFSYGIYLYGFPIQQIIASHFIGRISVVEAIMLAFLIIPPIAFLSWKFVENPTLKLKPRRNRLNPNLAAQSA